MEGEGVTAPRLVGSQAIKNPATLIQRILYGGGDMPPFDHLTEAEVAAIANYVRTGLNDRTDVVKPEDVAASK